MLATIPLSDDLRGTQNARARGGEGTGLLCAMSGYAPSCLCRYYIANLRTAGQAGMAATQFVTSSIQADQAAETLRRSAQTGPGN